MIPADTVIDKQYRIPPRPLVLVGLMGCGKSSVGRRLARRLDWPFIDVDAEIENAVGCTVADIFAEKGEAYFRDMERCTIARLLSDKPCILSTGGGAFMDEATRALIGEKAISVWLRSDIDTLTERTGRRNTRPLLACGNPRETLEYLMEARYPIYAQANVTVESVNIPFDAMVRRVIQAVSDWVDHHPQKAPQS